MIKFVILVNEYKLMYKILLFVFLSNNNIIIILYNEFRRGAQKF